MCWLFIYIYTLIIIINISCIVSLFFIEWDIFYGYSLLEQNRLQMELTSILCIPCTIAIVCILLPIVIYAIAKLSNKHPNHQRPPKLMEERLLYEGLCTKCVEVYKRARALDEDELDILQGLSLSVLSRNQTFGKI